MAFKKITDADVKGKGNVGRPDTPGVSTAEMQRIMDEIPREVIIPAFNALIDALADKTSAATLGITAPTGIAGSTVQEVVNALLAYVNTHKNDQKNPHAVTAAQVDAYTKKQTDDAISKKVIEIGAGDMTQAVYDPNGHRKDIFAAAMLRETYDPQGRRTDIFKEIDKVSNEIDAVENKLDQDTLLRIMTAPNDGAHNAIYRGKYLGTSVTEAQYAAISAGTFDDLYIGDYWTIGGVNYRIAAFDYYLNSGDTACTTHHAVIVPDTCLYNAAMNRTNTTTGGYVGSEMYKSNLEQAKSTIKTAFGTAHILTKREYMTNAVNDGMPSGGAWVDSDVELMNEVQVYGSVAWGAHNGNGNNVASGSGQFPLFMLDRTKMNIQNSYWLRDVSSNTVFSMTAIDGVAGYGNAAKSLGVRPAFCIS